MAFTIHLKYVFLKTEKKPESRFGLAVLRDGDPIKAANSLITEQGLRSIAASMGKTALLGNGSYNASNKFTDLHGTCKYWRRRRCHHRRSTCLMVKLS